MSAVPQDVEAERLRLEYRLMLLDTQDKARKNFVDFVRYVWPEALIGDHHRRMGAAFDRIAQGKLKRLIINMPPRHTKSEFASYLLPAFLMGQQPRLQTIEATHTAELAVKFGRKVRDLMMSDRYRELFPTVDLKQDSKAAGRWDTNRGGSYFAVGVGGAVTGRGADLLIIDDPHSEQDAYSDLALDNAWDWYQGGPRTRLQPGGSIVIVMCMTGDTAVLMADGTTKPLRDIRKGDAVVTYDEGRPATSRIANWKSSGIDSVYKVQTQSGRIVRANERHPFLVDSAGERTWVRLRDLRPGMALVSMTGAADPLGQRPSQDCASPANPERATTESTLSRPIVHQVITVSGKAKHALAAISRRIAEACAQSAMQLGITGRKKHQSRPAPTELKIDMGLPLSSTNQWPGNVGIGVTYAENPPLLVTPERIGTANFASITATIRARFEDFSATIATWLWGTGRPQKSYVAPLHTYNFTTDPIVAILPDGQEEVFDVEVERTENFIANGIVSHNTRWGTKDLTARLLKAQSSRNADRWEVIEFPAILPSGNPLWPEFWKLEELEAVKSSLSIQKWNAMYQQQPTNDEGAILKREWWRVWEAPQPPIVNYIIQSYDTAYSKKETADYSVITTWGVFYPNQDSGPNIILLDVVRGRWDFPELKRIAKDEYKRWNPDNVLIEAKATGVTLQQELRRMGIPVTMYTPGGRRSGTDKVSRANAVAPVFEAGMVWAPDTDWAEELVEECAAFPNGDNDDMVDSTTQAIMRFRQGNFLSLNTDYQEMPGQGRPLVPEYY